MLSKDLYSTGFKSWPIYNCVAFVFLLIVLIPEFLIRRQGYGLEGSYKEALQWITQHGAQYQFGTDVAYTFGPLGFLGYKMANNWWRVFCVLAVDIYIYLNLVYIIKGFFPTRSLFIFLILALTIYFEAFDGQFFGEPVYFSVFLYSVFSFLHAGNYKRLLNATFISILGFFIKASFGLVQFGLLLLVILYMVWTEKDKTKAILLYVMGVIIALFFAAFMLHVNIPAYLVASKEVIGGYNEAMVIPVSIHDRLFQLAGGIMIIYVLMGVYFLIRSGFDIKLLLRYLFTTAFIGILFKFSFVRADEYHAYNFFEFIAVAIGIHYLFEQGQYKKWIRLLFFASLGVASFVFVIIKPGTLTVKNEFQKQFHIEYFKDLAGGASAKFGFATELVNAKQLPDRIKTRIGKNTVDLMSHDLSLIFINRLGYDPRPTLQSFCAYTPYLDSMNYRKYESKQAPEYLFYTCNTIDGRPPFWDESITKRAVTRWYTVVDSFMMGDGQEKYLLLERKKYPTNSTTTGEGTKELKMCEKLFLDTLSPYPQYMYANVKYTLVGQLKKSLVQPAILRVAMGYADGGIDTFRAVVPILKTGVLINRKVITTDDARAFFKTHGADNIKVRWVQFIGADNFSFQEKINYRLEAINYSNN